MDPVATAAMPSIGRIVHFRATPSSDVEAALIVAVHSNKHVNVVVWNADGASRVETAVELADNPTDGSSWSWPPRVG